jgi:hypothetical protein
MGRVGGSGGSSAGAVLAAGVRRDFGVRVGWEQAEEVLTATRRSIQARAFEALQEVESNPTAREAILEGAGIQFRLAGRLIWVGRRGRNFVVRIKV